MTQGDLSVMDFGKKMKLVADALREVGHPVSEPTLVLNLLRGIHSKFSNIKDIVAGTKDTFDEALNQFALKELRMANEAKVLSSTALVAATTSCGSSCRSSSSAAPPPQQHLQLPQQQQQQRRRRKKGGNGNGGAPQQQQQFRGPTPTGPWFCFSPWGAPGGPSGSSGGGGGSWRG